MPGPQKTPLRCDVTTDETEALAAHLRFSPSILARLGEELNPDFHQGIVELVKNSYDADATLCTVDLIDVTDKGGRIVVHDNGRGMNAGQLQEAFLVIGESQKKNVRRTPLGREMTGDKGLGRLAALRLGRRAVVTSRERDVPRAEHQIILDWDAFAAARVINDVPIRIDQHTRELAEGPGTRVVMEDLRNSLSRAQVKRLARALVLLTDPFEFTPQEGGFTCVLRSSQFSDLAELVQRRYFDDAEFHLRARLERGRATLSVLDFRGRQLYSADHARLSSERHGKAYDSPDCTFDFWAFLLDATTFSTRSTTIGEVRAWLTEFGGVHVYQNDVRVAPYGEANQDWLSINLARSRDPQHRPSTNNSIGRVLLRDPERRLTQKTDRSGFYEDLAFEELRAFLTDCLEFLAVSRLRTAEGRRRLERKRSESEADTSRRDVRSELEDLPGPSGDRSRRAFRRYETARNRETHALRKEVQLYRTLATAGINAATFAHESRGNPLKIIRSSTSVVRKRAERLLAARHYQRLAAPLESIDRAVDSLSVLTASTLSLLEAGKRRTGAVRVNSLLQRVKENYEPFLLGRDVSLELSVPDEPLTVYGSEAALESILTNAINNSLVALEESATEKRRIRVEASRASESLCLVVADNGRGLQELSTESIWLPGITSREDGTGLGLTIVRDAVSDLGGNVTCNSPGVLGGFDLVVHAPLVDG